MRVLFVTPPKKKAFYSMAPLAGAIRTAGHEVCVTAHPGFARTISDAGLAAVPVGDRSPAAKAGSPEPAEVVRFAEHWHPDLIIGEPSAAAGPAAASATGAPLVQLLWNPEDGDTEGQFTIGQLPPSLRADGSSPTFSLRHTPYTGPTAIHTWLWAPPRRPRISLVPGSGILAGFVDCLADLDIEIIATDTDTSEGALAVFPANVRLGSSAPHTTLIPGCAAVIHDASPDTVATSALYGVPQLALPARPGESLAGKLTEYGAGLHISTAERTGERIRDALLRLLDEPSFQQRADRLRDEVLAMPTANDIVPRLEKLASHALAR